MLVTSGHVDHSLELGLEERHVEVLRDDVERYYFLFAALHHPFQLQATRLIPAEVDAYLEMILFGARDDVDAFLTRLDHGVANGALANLVRIYTGADYERMRAGHWFGTGITG